MKMSRQEANRKILEIIAEVIDAEPDWRFHQILQNIGIEIPNYDHWHEESETTLKSCNVND